MAEGTFSKEDFERMQNELARMYELQQKTTSSLSEYYKQLERVGNLQRDLNNLKKQHEESQKKEKTLREEINKKLAAANTLSKKKAFLISDEGKSLNKQLKEHQAINGELKKQTGFLEANLKREQEQVNALNAKKALYNSIGGQIKKAGKYLYAQTGYLLDQQKALKTAELSMGVLSNQSGMFRKNLIKASHTTNLLGVDTKKLAEIQASYSDQVGRAVVLSKENLEAMAELSSGTMMGVEGATAMAAQMEIFGKSAKSTAIFVEDVLNSSNKIGTNSNKVLSNVNKGLKLMNRLSFKDGVRGMAKMASDAAKLGFEMDSIAVVSDKLFNPEGAVELAAQLQVLGGRFSQLADPFTLMYQARNAPEELAKGLYEAAGASAHFNKETKEFEVAALELHRLKEVASATGLDYEELVVSAKKFAKLNMAKTQISGNFDDETREYLSTISDLNDKSGKFEIVIKDENGEPVTKALDELNRLSPKLIQDNITRIKEEKKSLKERAINAQTFDETFRNIINQFKSTLLPAFEGLSKGLENGLKKFTDWTEREDIFNKISKFSEKVGELAASVIKFVTNNPITTLLGIGLFKAAQWILNGRMLALGFNMGANVGGAGGGMPFSGSLSKGIKGFKGGKGIGGKIGGFSKGLGKVGSGLGLGIAGMGLDYGRSKMDDPDSGLGKGLGIGASALQGAGLGMMFGPWGAAIGALLGGAYGAYQEFGGDGPNSTSRSNNRQPMQDFVMRPRQDAVPFTSKDTLVGLKDGGPIEKSFGKIEPKSSNGKMNISFSPIKIDFGILTLKSGDSSVNLDLEKDPILAREISRIVQENIRKAIGGGKLNPNVI